MSADGVRHLYVHLPFCPSRCSYCDFVTLVGRLGDHGRYVDSVLAELELERDRLSRLRHTPAVTLDGERVELQANIELPGDAPGALEAGGSVLRAAQMLHERLSARGYDGSNLKFVAAKRGAHNEKAWRRRAPGAIRFLFGRRRR